MPLTVRALPLVCYGACIVVVDCTGSDLLARLMALLPPQAQARESEITDVRYEVQSGTLADPAAPRSWDIIRDGRQSFRAPTIEAVVRWLRSDIDHQVALHARGSLFVHAGVVSWRGQAILVPGRSMTGKSTLVAELVRRGALYYSDEYAVMDDQGRVHPYARPLSLRNGSWSGDSAQDGGIVGVPADLEPARPLLIVSTAYREGSAWCPAVVTGARAALSLVDNTILAATEPGRTIQLAATVGPSVVMLQGLRPDAALVAPEVLRFLDDLLDGRAASRQGNAVIGHRQWGSAYDAPSPRAPGWVLGDSAPLDAPTYRARYWRLDSVLEPSEQARLLDYASGHEEEFQPGMVFLADRSRGGVVAPDVRRARDKKEIDPVWDLFESRLQELLPRVRRVLGIPWFPVAGLEHRLVAHGDGDFFGVHTDSGRLAVARRRITAIYYFHAMPKRFSGGALRLYDGVLRDGRIEAGDTYTDLEPVDNTLVFFPSDLFHEVRPVRADGSGFRESRFTVNMWYLAETPSGAAHQPAANA